jgi:hypothetical protein
MERSCGGPPEAWQSPETMDVSPCKADDVKCLRGRCVPARIAGAKAVATGALTARISN